MTSVIPKLEYAPAGSGAPDRFVLLRDTTFYWRDCPERFWTLASATFHSASGCLMRSVDADGRREILLLVRAGFHASVSVAPDSPRSTPGAFPHDWIYEHSGRIAALWGCPARDVLELADWWFLALLTFTGFFFRRTYFTFVRLFGCAFNRIFGAKP